MYRAPRGFKQKPLRVGDRRPGDFARAKRYLGALKYGPDGRPFHTVDVSLPRKRKGGKRPPGYLLRINVNSKDGAERLAVLTAQELRELATEYGWVGAWGDFSRPLVVSRAVYNENRKWRPK